MRSRYFSSKPMPLSSTVMWQSPLVCSLPADASLGRRMGRLRIFTTGGLEAVAESLYFAKRFLQIVGGDVGKVLKLAIAVFEPSRRGFQPLLRLFALGDFLLQFLGAFLDALLQIFPGLFQFGVAGLDLRQHVVESVDQLAQFVVALFDRAEGVIFPRGHGAGGFGEVQNG